MHICPFAALEQFASTAQSDEAERAFAIQIAPLLFRDVPIVPYICDNLPCSAALVLLRYYQTTVPDRPDPVLVDALQTQLRKAWHDNHAALVRRVVAHLNDWGVDLESFFAEVFEDVDADRVDLLADLHAFPHHVATRLAGAKSSSPLRRAILRRVLTEDAAREIVHDLLDADLLEDTLMLIVRFPSVLNFDGWHAEGWKLMRTALLSHDGRIQKPARYIVERLAPPSTSMWEWFWAVFEATQEFTAHVLKEKWTKLITLWESVEDSALPHAMGRQWAELLMVLCLTHPNDSVQKFAVEEIIASAWDFSERFLFDHLLPAAIESSLYREKHFEPNLKAFCVRNEGCSTARLWECTAAYARKGLHFVPLRILCQATLLVAEIRPVPWSEGHFREAVYLIEEGLRDVPRAARCHIADAVLTLFPGCPTLPIATLRLVAGLPCDLFLELKEAVRRVGQSVSASARLDIWRTVLHTHRPCTLALPSSAFIIIALCRLEWADPSGVDGEEMQLLTTFLKNIYAKPYLAKEAIQHGVMAFNILTSICPELQFADCHDALVDYASCALSSHACAFVDAPLLFTALDRIPSSSSSQALKNVATAALRSDSAEARVISMGLAKLLPEGAANPQSTLMCKPKPVPVPLVDNGPFGTEVEQAWDARIVRDRFCPIKLFQEGFSICENDRDQQALWEWLRWQHVTDRTMLLEALDGMCEPEVVFGARALRRCSWGTCTVDDLHVLARGAQSFLTTASRKALLPTTLHEVCMMAFNPNTLRAEYRLCPNGDGPIHQLFDRALILGEAQVNVARACTMSILAALATMPSCPPAYVQSLASLLLYKEAVIQDGAFPRSLSVLANDYSVETCKVDGLQQTTAYARLCALAYFDALDDHALVRQVALDLLGTLDDMFEAHRAPKHAGGKPGPETPLPLSGFHRSQLRAWQALVVLAPKIAADKEFVDVLFLHLRRNHLPDVRDYQELFTMHLCHRYPDFILPPLLEQLRALDDMVQVTASFIHVLGFALKQNLDKREALEVLVPHMTSNFSFVRGMAQYVFFTSVAAEDDAFLASLPMSQQSLFRMCSTNRECTKMRRKMMCLYNLWDPADLSRLDVLAAARLVPAPSGQSFDDFVDFRPSQVFLTEIREAIQQEMADKWDRDNDFSKQDSKSFLQRDMDGGKPKIMPETPYNQPTTIRAMCQRKFDPLGHNVEHIEDLFRDGRDMIGKRKRRDFVVVASFVNKAPNLAGLCRTCEVFNARALCIPNKRVLADPNFTSMSVTAEKWLPLWEVPPKDVVPFVRNLRCEGYTIVGVEQTHQSQMLGTYEFPEKTCLLLGAEKEGLSADIITECDVCVEIPQEGNIRSLNVHVSGAMCIWECTRQIVLQSS